MLPGKKLDAAFLTQALRRRFWIVVIPPAVAAFAALVYSSGIPDLYQSEMLVAVDPQRVPDAIVRPTVTLSTDRRLDALKVKVLSRTAIEALIQEFDLYQDERKKWLMEDVVSRFRANVDLQLQMPRPRWGEEPQPTAFRVTFTYPDPNKATQVVERLGSYFVEQNIAERGAQANATNAFLEKQLADSRARLEAQERKLEEFRQRHGQELPTQMNVNMQAQSTAQARAQSLVESIARDRDRKMMLERLYRDAQAERPQPVQAPVRAAGGPPNAGTAQQQLADARAALAALELRYTADHPDVMRARRTVSELEPKAAAELRAAAATPPPSAEPAESPQDATRRENLRQMRAEIESLDRQVEFKEAEEQRVRGEIGEYQRRIEAVPGLESDWVALTRDYDTQQAAYRELLSKSQTAKLAANLEEESIGERFRIVDQARVPVRPLPSQRIRYNAAGLALGLLIGLGLAALLEVRDQSFRSATEVLEVLGLPVLATVPYVPTSDERTVAGRRQRLIAAGSVACVLAAGYVAWAMKLWKSVL